MQNPKTKLIIKTALNTVLIAVFIGGLIVYQNYYKNKNNQNDNSINDNKVEAITSCGLTITDPIYGQSVGQNFAVVGTLDNSEREALGCAWVSFEAQAGVVYVKDGMGNDVAAPTPFTTKMDWMTDEPVIYGADIEIKNGYTGKALVIINENDPSGENLPKTINFPVRIK